MSVARWIRRVLLIPIMIIAFFAAALPTNASSTSARNLVVPTDKGVVRGVEVDGVRQFLGIPYAASPAGDNRWKPPQPAAGWVGVRDASTFAPHCAQSVGAFGVGTTNEDCLFLNVFVPKFAVPGIPIAPVMVWIHGGALSAGQSEAYNPAELTAKGVIVVTINYRLGALGFLAHRSFAGESPEGAAGNYGLLDQQAAMRWVERNIRHFGGNRNSVTIFGESAGGLSVHSHLASPLAKGLFDKAIVQSGAYQPVQASLATAENTADAFAIRAGCPDQTAACLRALPVETLLAQSNATIAAPTVDGFFLKASLNDAFTSGEFNKVPVIEGSNHDEWALFVGQQEVQRGAPLSAAAYIPTAAATIAGGLGVTPAQAAPVVAANYPLANYESPSLALTAAGTDAIFACNARRLTTALSGHTTVYQYEFNDPNAPQRFFPNLSFPTRAYHAAEIQYVFSPVAGSTPPARTEEQEQLRKTMIRYWTQFAWLGTPNFFGTPFWPRFDEDLEHQALVPGTSHRATGFTTEHKCSLYGVN